VLEKAGKEQLTVGEWPLSSHFSPISTAKEVNIKSSILKCKLIGFELALNIKADIMFLKKYFCFTIKTHFPFKGKYSLFL
jgi:hypothetical protein